ncbi:hypothetical protein THAOC_03694 [Thalassiosira oceanica]|uniref:Uncharacterized protein n=1 Tax=Thalassiosira oceanica TaxID=159749 RepID=K0T773_THAOC|nr:hypothetical protein THAOC_03694 [Thalassiosira oceanica]|eukprot:EJK74618.1 hypothetical protein THAOC_03694 [Thalassiosira oceanica]
MSPLSLFQASIPSVGGASVRSGRSRFSRVARSMSPFGRSKHRSSKDSPHSSKTPSRIPGLPPTGRSKAPFSSKATIAKVKGLCEESQVTAQGRCELSGLSPQKADVDADVDHEKPMDNKIDSCHSNGYEPVIVSSPELRVQPPKSENEEKSPLFIEIGHELVEIDLTNDEPTVPGRQVFDSPSISKDEIEGLPNAGLPADAEEKTAPEMPPVDLEEKTEAEKARIEAEKAREEADKMAERIRRKAEKKEKEEKKLRETARMDEERFAARQRNRGARNDVAKFNAPMSKSTSNESLPKAHRVKTRGKSSKAEAPAKETSKDFEKSFHTSGKSVNSKMSHQRVRTQKRALSLAIESASPRASSASLVETTANAKKAPTHRRAKSPQRLKQFTAGDEAEEGKQGKTVKQGTPVSGKAKSLKKQGMSSKKEKSESSKSDEPKSKTQSIPGSPGGYIPLAERRSSCKPFPVRRPINNEMFDSFDDESSISSDEDDVRDDYEPSRRVPKGRGSRQFTKQDRTFKTVVKSKTQPVSRSANRYIPRDERRRDGSFDEDDVRDECESPRRGRKGRGSRQFIKQDRTFETDPSVCGSESGYIPLAERSVRDEYESPRRGRKGRRSRQFTEQDRTSEAIESLYTDFERDNHDVVYQQSIFDNVIDSFACVG